MQGRKKHELPTDYAVQFADFNALVSIGAFGFGLAQLYFLFFVLVPVLRKKGKPAPFHTFDKPPDLRTADSARLRSKA